MSHRNQVLAVASLSLLLLAGRAGADSVELVTRITPGTEPVSGGGTSETYNFVEIPRPPAGNALSSDGRYAVFVSTAPNLVPGQTETNGFRKVFLRDRETDTMILVSRSSAGGSPNSGSDHPVISADGRYVAFHSHATDLVPGQVDTNDGADVFLFDRVTGTMTLVSRAAGATATTADAPSDFPVISADGSRITFTSTADNLVAGASSTLPQQVYLFDRAAGTNVLVSHASGSSTTPGDGFCNAPVLSADGRFVAYTSTSSDLVAGQSNGGNPYNVFLYDQVSDAAVLVSRTSGSATTTAGGQEPRISADGGFVTFSSYGADLVAGQSGPPEQNVFLYRRSDGLVTLVSHTAVSQQTGNGPSRGPVISADGSHVAFESHATDLTGTGDVTAFSGIFLYERATGTLTFISPRHGAPQQVGNSSSFYPVISADGSRVVFQSLAWDLLPQPVSQSGLYLYSKSSGSLTLVSRSLSSPAQTGNSYPLGHFLSANGGFVLFASGASDLVAADSNGRNDVFLFDRSTGSNALISRADPANPSVTPIWGGNFPSISADGNQIVFRGYDPNRTAGQVDLDLGRDIFVWFRLTGATTLVSQSAVAPDFTADAPSRNAKISGDGEWILFSSWASDLVPGQTQAPTGAALFLSRRTTGEKILVTHVANAPKTPAAGSPGPTGLSANGRFVVYTGLFSEVVPGMSGGGNQLFLYDRVAGTTSLVSHAAASPATSGDDDVIGAPTLSADGRFVAFASMATDLVAGQTESNGGTDVFLYDRTTGAVTLVSRQTGSVTTTGDRVSDRPEISADGRWIAFRSEASDLVPGQIDTPGSRDLFLHDRLTGTTVLVSHTLGAPLTAANGPSTAPVLSADGRFLAYMGEADDLTAGSSDTCPLGTSCADIYLYDRTTGENVLVSHSASSPAASGGRQAYNPQISANGRYVTFTSESADHVPGVVDAERTLDTFLYDRTTGEIELLSRRDDTPSLARGGLSAAPNADGSRIALTGAELVPGDFNGVADVYLYNNDLPGTSFFVLPPCRLFDTRRPEDGPALVSGGSVILSIDGGCGIPATAQALAVNVTAFLPTGSGNLTVYPGDLSPSGTSTMNFPAGVVRANNGVVRLSLDGSGSLGVRASVGGGGSVHVIVDVTGYFE